MVDHVQSLLAEAAQALLAGRPQEARTRYEACATEVPRLASLGLAITAWTQGDYRALRATIGRALEGAEADPAFPLGFAWALEGLALLHEGAIAEGLRRQAEGLEAARLAGEGAELNAMVAIADARLHVGRWAEARATIAGVRPAAVALEATMAVRMLDRLALALAVLEDAPEAGDLAQAAAAEARARGDDAGLAWALRWQGAWLQAHREPRAAAALEEAVALAARAGQHHVAAEALTHLAALGPPALRAERLATARMHARASGSAIAEIDVAARQGGATARDAARRLEALLAPLPPDDRAAYLAWPGRAGATDAPAADPAALERLGGTLAAIAAQPDLRGVLQAALRAFVEVAGAEHGFLLRLAGFEVLDQVIEGAAPDSYSTSLADRIVWTGEPLVVEDLEADAELGGAASVRALGLRTALGVPLVASGEVVGVMLADSREAHPGFGPETLALARAIAGFVVVAVEQAERTDQARAERAAEAAIARAATAAAGAATLEAALPAIAAEAGEALGAERLFVHLGPDLAVRAAVDRAGRPLEGARPSEGVVRWVADHGEPLLLVDAQADEAFADRPSIRDLALRAIHAAPIGHRGVLYLDSRDPAVGRPEAARVLAGLAAIVGALLAREG
jgi:GAF domain-containing protein